MRNLKWLALLLPGLALLMAPTGGYPSRPTFLSAGVGVAAPASGLTVASGTTAVQALTATTGAFTGAITGASHSGGPHSGTTGAFTGAITGASYSGGPISGTTGTYTGAISGASYSGGAVSGTTGGFSGAVTGASYSGGAVSGTSGTFTAGAAVSGGTFTSRGLSDSAASTVVSIASNGPVTFSGQSSTAATYGNNSFNVTAPSTTGGSNGIYVTAGTNASDHNLFLANQANTVGFFEVFGDGGVIVGSPTGSDKGVGTVNAVGFYQNGVPIKHAYAGIITAAGSCSIASGITAGNVSACARTGVGAYNVTVAGFSNPPACSISNVPGTQLVSVLTQTSTVIAIMVENNAGSPVDIVNTGGNSSGYPIVCVGS